ncbi:hypothetical protein D3C86_1168070 [compost metagenome]
MRIQLRAEGAADGAHLPDQLLAAGHRARHQVAMAAHVFRERVHAQVHAMLGRLLEDRPQERVVANRDRAIAVARLERVQLVLHRLEVEQRVGRIGGRFDVEHLHRPLGRRVFQRGAHALGRQAVRNRMRAYAPLREDLADQGLGAAIQGHGLHQLIAGPQESHQDGADRRHAAGSHRRVFGTVQQRQAVFHDFQVRVVEAAVHQPGGFPLRQGFAARHQVKESRAVLGRAECERRRQEHRRLDRALGQKGVVAVGHHLRFRMQGTAENVFLVIARISHGVPLSLVFQPTGQARHALKDDSAGRPGMHCSMGVVAGNNLSISFARSP